jgi:lysophospholipase L1-like esterase
MNIWVFGDSLSIPYNLTDGQKGWPEILSLLLDSEIKNFARPAADNFYIYHSYKSNLLNIKAGDIVVIGWSHFSRKSFVYDDKNPIHTQNVNHSFVYESKGTQFIRSRNLPDNRSAKWVNFLPKETNKPFYDIWFRDYYSEEEQKTNLMSYYYAVASTCPGIYVPFFFSKDGVDNLKAAGHALEFIMSNNCFISEKDSHFSSEGHRLWANHLMNYIKSEKYQTIFPVIELFDRLAIATVKWKKTQNNKDELRWYQNQTKFFKLDLVDHLLKELIEVHESIWESESELKSGKEHRLPLEEIGRRALIIRDKNNYRVKLKNLIADKLLCLVKEIKKDHLSQ